MDEALTKLRHDLEFIDDGMRAAYSKADPLEQHVLLGLIEKASTLRKEFNLFAAARERCYRET